MKETQYLSKDDFKRWMLTIGKNGNPHTRGATNNYVSAIKRVAKDWTENEGESKTPDLYNIDIYKLKEIAAAYSDGKHAGFGAKQSRDNRCGINKLLAFREQRQGKK